MSEGVCIRLEVSSLQEQVRPSAHWREDTAKEACCFHPYVTVVKVYFILNTFSMFAAPPLVCAGPICEIKSGMHRV